MVERWEGGMKKALVLTVVVAVVLALPGVALAALPSETPDDTLMVDGRVRAIEQVGTNIWMGGKFTQVKQRNGTVVANVLNVAVLDSATGQSVDGSNNIAPKLGGTGAEVFDMASCKGDVLIAGKFAGPSSTQKNLVLVDGENGQVLRWFNNAPSLKSVLAAPLLEAMDCTQGRVYGGGVSLSAFDLGSGKKLWTKAKTTVDKSLRTHDLAPAYRDLELDADGSTIWAACSCDAVAAPDGTFKPAKALVKLSSEGVHDASWVASAGEGAFGHSLVDANGALYLGAGGSDFVAEFSKANGTRTWVRDTSGSTQVVEVMDNQLLIGGHFWEVAVDQEGDKCGAGQDYSALNPDGTPKLDPQDNGDQIVGECATRHGVAAYSFKGDLDRNWSPQYSGSYSLLWTLQVEGSRLHTGGQFKKINGVTQTNYARLSPTVLP
jgi:hypothetical protein